MGMAMCEDGSLFRLHMVTGLRQISMLQRKRLPGVIGRLSSRKLQGTPR